MLALFRLRILLSLPRHRALCGPSQTSCDVHSNAREALPRRWTACTRGGYRLAPHRLQAVCAHPAARLSADRFTSCSPSFGPPCYPPPYTLLRIVKRITAQLHTDLSPTMPSVADIQITRPVLSEPPSLSARGQRSLVRPPLLRCSLFNCQYNACLNQAGLLNLGVAENVSTRGRRASTWKWRVAKAHDHC